MSSACMTSSRSCIMSRDLSGPAAPGVPILDTLSFTLMPHPLDSLKFSTITWPSVMLMNSSTRDLCCVYPSSGRFADASASRSRAASAAASLFFSNAAVIFACISGRISSKPAGSCRVTPVPSALPTAPLSLLLPFLPLYAPFSWYMTPSRVRDPPPKASDILATRCSVLPRNRLRSARIALMIIPSYSTIFSSSTIPSGLSSCGDSLAMSLVNSTSPVKSSRTRSTSSPLALAPSATANAAQVAAYLSTSDASPSTDTTVVWSMAPAALSSSTAATPPSSAAAPVAP
mmetsp:Transcript_2102/g.9542  ORF Transcript_2102/g.9542 Transcript_2102/m.9542 type:complete len:288 (+) Transcript_2102:355-1218(+)